MNYNKIGKTLNCLISKGIKLICIDFDNTLLSISTYGRWDDTAEKLIKYTITSNNNSPNKNNISDLLYLFVLVV